MDRDAVKRWHAGHQAANARALALLGADPPPSPARSFAQAMELCALATALPASPLREREVAQARAAWLVLKQKWAAKHALPR